MNIYPAIDIKDGKCVRLTQGDFNQSKIYEENPVIVAKRWEEAGAKYLHIVDLDGATKGFGVNEKVIEEIAKSVNMEIQVGGGIRNLEMIERKLSIGVNKVILGTAAVKNLDFVEEAVNLYKEKIIIGIDAKDGKVAIEGWEEVSSVSVMDLTKKMESLGVKRVIYTDISKDGMLSGPNFKGTQELIENTSIEIVASGGVHHIEDIKKLKEIKAFGVIIGKALYERKVNLREVISLC